MSNSEVSSPPQQLSASWSELAQQSNCCSVCGKEERRVLRVVESAVSVRAEALLLTGANDSWLLAKEDPKSCLEDGIAERENTHAGSTLEEEDEDGDTAHWMISGPLRLLHDVYTPSPKSRQKLSPEKP